MISEMFFRHVQHHLLEFAVQFTSRLETSFHELAPIRFAPYIFFHAFW